MQTNRLSHGLISAGVSLASIAAAFNDATDATRKFGLEFASAAAGIGDMMADVNGLGIRARDPHLYGAAPYKRHDAGTRTHRAWKKRRAAGRA